MRKTIYLTYLLSVFSLLPSYGGSNEKITVSGEISSVEVHSAAPLIIDTDTEYQKVIGFGGMNTKWQASTLSDNEITTLYGNGEGQLGYNVLRVRISPNGERDWKQVVGTVRKAKSLGATILATPWTPPVGLKNNHSIVQGELGDTDGYAAYLKSFVRYMQNNGADIDVLSIQNEPDIDVKYESCQWSPAQIYDFVKKYGAELRATGVKLMASEHSKFNHDFTDPLLQDAQVAANVDCIGGHIYGGGLVSYDLVAQKGKEYWMTEHYLNKAWKDKVLTSPEALRTENMAFAEELNNCMNLGFNVYIWWYLRRFYSMLGDGDGGSVRSEVTTRGYFLSHFAKYATGRIRVKATLPEGAPSGISATAYKNAEGDISVILVNSSANVMRGLKIALPFKAAKAVKVVTTSGTTPADTVKKMVQSKVKLAGGVDVDAYSVVTLLIKKL